MWKPTNQFTVGLAAGALILSVCTLLFAGARTSDESSVGRAESFARDGFQFRCWQYGQLLFEENNVEVPEAAAQRAIVLQRNHGRPSALYVFETKNATCLAKRLDVEAKQ